MVWSWWVSMGYLACAVPLLCRYEKRVADDTTPRAAMFHVERSLAVMLWFVACAVATALLRRHGAAHPWLVTSVVVDLPMLVLLVAVDVRTQRLPNRYTAGVVVATMAVLACSVAVSAWRGFPLPPVGSILLGGVASCACHLALSLAGRGQGMGLGDAKLAATLGALAAWRGGECWLAALVLPFFIGGVWGMVLLARGKGRRATMPFGPCLAGGSFVALMV